MWTKAAVKAHQVAKAVAEKWDEPIAKLEELAKYAPAFADRVKELRIRRDNLHQLASTALAIDPTGK
jgi:hypothetical protein